MDVQLKYGAGYMNLQLPDRADVTYMHSQAVPCLADPLASLQAALDAPLDTPAFAQMPMPASVAIAVPDETRPVPLTVLLPPLLARMFKAWAGLLPEMITIVVGGGLHAQPDAAQLARILPQDLGAIHIVAHCAMTAPMVSYGFTTLGTPVEINAAFAEAAYKVVVGMVDPHQFVGMTGGAKGAVVGCGSQATIQANHKHMTQEAAFVGNIADNPVRNDLNEAGEMVGVDLVLNVSLTPEKAIAALFVGRPESCMRAAAAVTENIYRLPYSKPYDIVIASCGGYPKDICLYQAQKGLNMASSCLRPGGHLLLLAACVQGIGDERYEHYVQSFTTLEALMEDFRSHDFQMGAHKAFLFGRSLKNFDVAVHSELSAACLAQCFLSKVTAQQAIDNWLRADPEARIAIVPYANAMYFYQQQPT